ncbi:hypothetical protein EPN52_13580 [bacterium]|nr:MAG: hypothetical protein EPN52_13580 [bacterium]
MTFENLLLATESGVATITINTPPVNALSAKTMTELGRAFDALEGEAGVRAVVVTGAGENVFIGGADIGEFTRIASPEDARAKMRSGAELFRRIELYPKPVLAAINGICAGGGCELALACDLRIMAEPARIGQPEIKLGIIPGWGGTQRLPRLVGPGNALMLTMTGETISAAEALRIGLVNAVVPAGAALERAGEIARLLAQRPPLALAALKRAVTTGLDEGYAAGIACEQSEMVKLFSGTDVREGIAAFLAKRSPVFRGA